MRKNILFLAVLWFTAFSCTAKAEATQAVACTAGKLSVLANSFLTTVTNLNVTGTIDARDFKTMRDSMPVLTNINLSGAKVVAYKGTEGTNGSFSIAYPANGIPDYAFCPPLTNKGKINLNSFIYPSSITSIGSSAFNYCSGLSGLLKIPSTVTAIGNYAFEFCCGFTGDLTIPSSVKSIGDYAFYSCRGFNGSLNIGSSVTTIGSGTFRNCRGLSGTLNLPSSLTTIDASAFEFCSGFTGDLTIPSSVTTIRDKAFGGCSGLIGTLKIPSMVTIIGSQVFRSCNLIFDVDPANPNYSSLDGVLFNKKKTTLMQCPISKTGSYTIPSSVVTFGYGAFWDCIGITTIYVQTIPPVNFGSAFGSAFGSEDGPICILHVPVGSKAKYVTADQGNYFSDIIEDIIPAMLESVSLNSKIAISLNPANAFLIVSELESLESEKMVTFSILDVSGNSLLVMDVDTSTSTLAIDVSSYKRGAYFIIIQTTNGSIVRCFVKP